MADYYMGEGITLFAEGEEVFLSAAVINELHRQENIRLGKDILANLDSEFIGKPYEQITVSEFEAYAVKLEENMMDDNGQLEMDTAKEVFIRN